MKKIPNNTPQKYGPPSFNHLQPLIHKLIKFENEEGKRCLDTAENFHTNRFSTEKGDKTKRLFRTNKLKPTAEPLSASTAGLLKNPAGPRCSRLSIFQSDCRPSGVGKLSGGVEGRKGVSCYMLESLLHAQLILNR